MYRRDEEGVLFDFLMVPWAMVRCGLWAGHWAVGFLRSRLELCDRRAEFVRELELSPDARIQPYASQGR